MLYDVLLFLFVFIVSVQSHAPYIVTECLNSYGTIFLLKNLFLAYIVKHPSKHSSAFLSNTRTLCLRLFLHLFLRLGVKYFYPFERSGKKMFRIMSEICSFLILFVFIYLSCLFIVFILSLSFSIFCILSVLCFFVVYFVFLFIVTRFPYHVYRCSIASLFPSFASFSKCSMFSRSCILSNRDGMT